MNIANLKATLSLDIKKFTSPLNSASGEVTKFTKKIVREMKSAKSATEQLASGYKEISRIVQGIFVSKAIYSTLNSIQDATSAVWNFTTSLEYADMVYRNLFGDAELAEEFINVLEDFAAISPFNFTDIEAATKRLKAYGIETENLLYVTQGVLAASAGQGNSNAIETISRALGQIYTKGTMKAEEARQLAEAGIPVYKILQEQLGLTAEEVGNLGDQAIPATTAINALVDGINQRFGNILVESADTWGGILSNIKDNILMIGSEAIDPFYQSVKKKLADVGTWIMSLKSIMNTQGIGGVFEAIVPKELQSTLRSLAANFLTTFKLIGDNIRNVGVIFRSVLPTILTLLNIFWGALNVVLGVTANLTQRLLDNKKALNLVTTALVIGAAAWVMWKAKAIGAAIVAFITTLFKKLVVAINTVSVALVALVRNPAWFLLIGLGVGMMYLTKTSDKFKTSLDNIISSLSSIGGVDADKLLLPSQKDRASDLDKFNEKLKETDGGMKDLAKSTGAAAKAGKGLLSFDEVFKLNDPDESATDGLDDIETPDYSGFDFDADFGGVDEAIEKAKLFGQDLINNILAPFEGKGIAMGLGATIGGILGGMIGGPAGAKIGLAVGAIAGYIWDEFAKKLGFNNQESNTMILGTGIGAIIGMVLGGPTGMLIGGAIGALTTNLWRMIGNKLKLSENTSTIMGIGTTLGLGIGAIFGGPLGAVVGGVIGGLVSSIISNFTAMIKAVDGDWDIAADAVKNMLIDAFFGVFNFETSMELFDIMFEMFDNAFTALKEGDWLEMGKNILLGLVSGLISALSFITEPIWDLVTGIIKLFLEAFGIHSPATAMMPVGENVLLGLLEGLKMAVLGAPAVIGKICTGLMNSFLTGLTEAGADVSEWFDTWTSEILGVIDGWVAGSLALFDSFTSFSFSDWCTSSLESIKGWAGSVWDSISDKFGQAITKVKEFLDLQGTSGTVTASVTTAAVGAKGVKAGHAMGGVFNREHVARFSEGNKAEAIIPLENDGAMQPFVTAVSNGLTASLAPILASMNSNRGNEQLRPLYVGTLVADERGLKELNRKMQVIETQENFRRGL